MGADTPGFDGGPEIGWRQRLSWWLALHWEVRAALLAVLLGVGAVLLFGLSRTPQALMHPREAVATAAAVQALESGLGFRSEDAGSRYRDYGLRGFLVVTQVVPGGAIAEAGIREGDAIPYPYLDCFYKSLAVGQGETVDVTVLRGTERLTLQVRVPDLGLPAAGVSWMCPDSIVPGKSASPSPPGRPAWR